MLHSNSFEKKLFMNSTYFKKPAIAIMACSLLMLAGCKKYLDQQPITEVSTEMVFKDVPSTYQALSGVYSRLVGDAGYGIRLSLYYPVDNDEMQGPTGASDNDRRDIARYQATSSNAQISNPFNQLFQGIEFANVCIANIPKMAMYTTGSEQDKKKLQRMYGEALTLRAQFYFEAIRNWGDLPAHFAPASSIANGNPFPTRVDRDTLYNHIIADLKTAEDLVPWRNELASIGDPIDERITKGTVKGLRARIALFRGGYSLRQGGQMERRADYQTFYQIARDETNDIITSGQHSLNPDFKSLWKNQVCAHVVADPNGELMFQVTAFGRSAASDAKVGFNSGPTVVDAASSTNPSSPSSFGTASVFILPTYFYYFDSTDTRRDVTCAPYQDTTLTDGVSFLKAGQPISSIFDGKYRRDWLNPPLALGTYANNYTGFKWQILRYSDVLLMFAEAENELNGPTGPAYTALNMVRRRGYGKSVTTADPTVDLNGLSKDDFFKAIVRERALEFGGEGVRKFDMIRWNLLATAITETRANLNKMGALQTMSVPSYMAPPPSYTLNTANLPKAMYYKIRTTSDDLNVGGLAVNSFYRVEPSATPAGTKKVNWVTAANITTVLGHYVNNFTANKSELLPIPQDAITAYGGFANNMPQNPGY